MHFADISSEREDKEASDLLSLIKVSIVGAMEWDPDPQDTPVRFLSKCK